MRLILLTTTAAALLVAGCGRSDTSSANKGTATVIAQGGNATVTKDANGSITATTPEGTAQIRSGAPSGNLPGGLPAYPNAQAAGGMEVTGAANGQQGHVVTFTTSDQPGQVLDFYANAASQAGMQTLARTNMGPNGTLALMKGSEAISVTTVQMGAQTQVTVASGTR